MFLGEIERDKGTLSLSRSRQFQKSVRKQSLNYQKTVSCKNLSDNHQNCVMKLLENCQNQNSVRNVSLDNWKCIQNMSLFINVLEIYQFEIEITVRNLS